jgi:antitoxin CcdA
LNNTTQAILSRTKKISITFYHKHLRHFIAAKASINKSLTSMSIAHILCAWKGCLMQMLYNSNAPKKAANLSINSDLLNQAKDLHINISSVLETALAEKVRQKKQEDWLLENKEAISYYNDSVSLNGIFSDGMRNF